MIDGKNYYEILGIPEDALLKEIQRAWRQFVKHNHEDIVPSAQRQAAKERMFQINAAYEVLSDEDKRAEYDNAHMLNGGSTIELVRIRVRKAKHVLEKARDGIQGEDFAVMESVIDYLDSHTQAACFTWMTELLYERPDMAKYVVALAFDEQLLCASTRLFDTLLERAAHVITWEKVYLYTEDVLSLGGTKAKEHNYNQLARLLCHRADLARYFVYPAFQEQASACESRLLPTLLHVAPQEITQESFDAYVDTVYQMRWIVYGQIRSYNEQAIAWVLRARPDLVRKPEPEKAPTELPFPLRS